MEERMKKKYYVIENGTTSGPAINDQPDSVTGPFASIAKAKAYIMADADAAYDTQEAAPINRPDEEWGSRYSILELEE